jgi:hypothetical protein
VGHVVIDALVVQLFAFPDAGLDGGGKDTCTVTVKEPVDELVPPELEVYL